MSKFKLQTTYIILYLVPGTTALLSTLPCTMYLYTELLGPSSVKSYHHSCTLTGMVPGSRLVYVGPSNQFLWHGRA